MQIPLRNGQTTAVQLVDPTREVVTVQFSKDWFGNMQVDAWCPGKAKLFSVNIPAGDIAEIEEADAKYAAPSNGSGHGA